MNMKHKAWIGVTAAFALAITGLTPTQAASTPVTWGNGECDFSAVGQGHGSATDPYLLTSALDIQEMQECTNRSKAISNATVNNDGTVTFDTNSTAGTFGVGTVVTIQGTDGNSLDAENARITASTDTSVTVKTSAAVGTTTGTGTSEPYRTYYKVANDIDLGAASSTSWNNNSSVSITAATRNSDGSITFTGANDFANGDNIYIDGMGDNTFNIGWTSVISATATEFVTNTSYGMNDGPASSAGGKAHRGGWQPSDLYKAEIDGAGHSIAGLGIYRNSDVMGLWGRLADSTIKNLTVSGAIVKTDGTWFNNGGRKTGVIAGEMSNVILSGVSVTNSTLVSGGQNAGLFAGYVDGASLSNVSVSGSVSFGASMANAGETPWDGYIGGIAGQFYNSTVTNASSSVTVKAVVEGQDSSGNATAVAPNKVYYQWAGGLFGRVNEFEARNLTATGNVTGRSYVGGAIGEANWDGQIANSSATGNVFAIAPENANGGIEYVGGFAGRMLGESDNVNVSASGNVSVNVPASAQNTWAQRIGGLTGYLNCCGANTNLKATGSVTVNVLSAGTVSKVGGLIGENDCCTIVSNSSSSGDVTVTTATGEITRVGGFVGGWNCCGIDRQNTVSGDVSVTITDPSNNWAREIGGYAGYIDGYGSMSHIAVTGNVTVNNGMKVGGFAGYGGDEVSYHDITVANNVTVASADNSNAGSTNNDWYANVGGFIGFFNTRLTMERIGVKSTVTVTGLNGGTPTNVGGLIGAKYWNNRNPVEVLNSYFIGSVTGGTNVAGLIGSTQKDSTYRMANNLIVATVTANGTNAVSDSVLNGWFIDTSKTNFVDSTVAGTSVNNPLFNAETTANLKAEATYTAKGWTFTGNSPWRIDATTNGGYPYLTVPANDDTRTLGGNSSTTVEKIVEKPVVIVYKTVKAISFAGKSVTLSKAQKKVLDAAAKTIKASTYTSFIVTVSPKSADLSLAGKRATAIQTYLMGALKKLRSSKVVTVTVTPNTRGSAKTVLVRQGK